MHSRWLHSSALTLHLLISWQWNTLAATATRHDRHLSLNRILLYPPQDAPLSSKVAMFNQRANNHQATQLLNPFSTDSDGRKSPRPQFSKSEYGKPLAGSLTEARGQKANIHVFREMCELCEIINGSGVPIDEDEPRGPKFIFFGELFNVSASYNCTHRLVLMIHLFYFPRSTFTFPIK